MSVKDFRVLGSIVSVSLIILVSACSKKTYVADVSTSYYRFDHKENNADAAIEELIRPYKEELGAQMSEVLATVEVNLKKGRINSTMGNWVADLLKEEAERLSELDVNFAIQNYGGLRMSNIPKGEVTKGQIFELMPFNNELVIVKINGGDVMKLADKIAENGGWPVSHGLMMSMNEGKAENVFISGNPVDISMDYRVAMPDYIANGGDKCSFLIGLEKIVLKFKIRDLIIDNLRRLSLKGKSIVVSRDKRINL